MAARQSGYLWALLPLLHAGSSEDTAPARRTCRKDRSSSDTPREGPSVAPCPHCGPIVAGVVAAPSTAQASTGRT
eukprot:3275061-Alexandrium_andersonii.AAC.1